MLECQKRIVRRMKIGVASAGSASKIVVTFESVDESIVGHSDGEVCRAFFDDGVAVENS